MFLGTSLLARATGVVHSEEASRTVMAEIALAVFGQGPAFYLVQVVTAAILILAANTAYADFPRLASVLAGDRFLPRQFVSRGDRLVFSNGILVLAGAASLLLILFNAEVSRLIQLYVVGVFTSFTLSQLGMVIHHRRLREPRWRRGALINGIGATTTGVVLIVVAVTKFLGGAWIVLLAIPALAVLMRRIHSHYRRVSVQLRVGLAEESDATRRMHIYIVVGHVDEAAAQAVSYAASIGAASVEAITLTGGEGLERAWAQLAPEVPLRVLAPYGARTPIQRLGQVLAEEVARYPGEFVTAVVAESLSTSWLEQLREHRTELRIKAALLRVPGLVVADVASPDTGSQVVQEPAQHHVVVLVSGLNRPTLRALSYARSLRPTSLRALSINLDTSRSAGILKDWEDSDITAPLEVVDSPFRSLGDTLQSYVREFQPDGHRTLVTCVLPEFVLPHWYHQPLHNQTALLIKSALLFERGVVTVSVPYTVADEEDEDPAAAVAISGRTVP